MHMVLRDGYELHNLGLTHLGTGKSTSLHKLETNTQLVNITGNLLQVGQGSQLCQGSK